MACDSDKAKGLSLENLHGEHRPRTGDDNKASLAPLRGEDEPKRGDDSSLAIFREAHPSEDGSDGGRRTGDDDDAALAPRVGHTIQDGSLSTSL